MGNWIDIEIEADRAVAYAASGPGAGVLVLHAWWGLNDFVRTTCDRLALAGFSALAPDLYQGETARTVSDAERLRDRLDRGRCLRICSAALDRVWLERNGRSGAAVLGFSLGASYALRLAAIRPEVAAVVLFYGAAERDTCAAGRSTILGHFAEHDAFMSLLEVRELRETLGARGTLHVYPGTHHWFCETDRPEAYDPTNAELAWNRTLAFLRSNADSRSR